MALYSRLENSPMGTMDPEIERQMEWEKGQQCQTIQLIASDNFTTFTVNEALGFSHAKKHTESNPGNRHYGSNVGIDSIAKTCCSRALEAYDLDPTHWAVNIHPCPGSPPNFAAYTAVLKSGDRIMGFDLPPSGHLTGGFYTSGGKKISDTSICFESLPYEVNSSTGYIDYDQLEKQALHFRPRLIICGSNAYPRDWDYARFCSIADKCGALLLCDMAHISGLVATQEAANPFKFCDIVKTTARKSGTAQRFAIIFYRKGSNPVKEIQRKDVRGNINFAVFRSVQGSMSKQPITALSIALRLAKDPDFKRHTKQVKANAVALASYLISRGYKLVTYGTENDLVLWDLRPLGFTGNNFGKLCDICNITVTKDNLFGQTEASSLGGVRMGTSPMTAVGCFEEHFKQIGEFLYRAVGIAHKIQEQHGMLPQDFDKGLVNNKEIGALRIDVEKFAGSFMIPKFLVSEMKSKD